MRVVFAGSPDIAVPALLRIATDHRIVGVLTNPESGQGRGRGVSSTPVAQVLISHPEIDAPVLQFEHLGGQAREAVAALEPDILVSFAYGRIFGPRFLALFPKGGINVHPSLLPRYRGCAPIPQAILNQDSETGVAIQRLALEMDSGDILASRVIPLGGRETTADLSLTAASLGAELAALVLADMESGTETATPQSGEPSYCGMIRKDDGLIDWSLPSLEIDARIRAYQPWPGAFTFLGGQRLGILEAMPYPSAAGAEELRPAVPGTVLALDRSRGIMVQTRDGMIALRRLQLPTKKALPFKDFANGLRNLAGTVLGQTMPEDPRIQS